MINYSPPLNIFAKISTQELEYRAARLEKNYSSMFFSLIVALVVMFLTLVFSICKLVVLSGFADSDTIVCRSIVVVYLLVLVIFNSKLYKKPIYPYLNMIFLIFMHIIVMLELVNNPMVPVDFVALEVMYIIVLLNQISAINLFYVVFMNLIIFIT